MVFQIWGVFPRSAAHPVTCRVGVFLLCLFVFRLGWLLFLPARFLCSFLVSQQLDWVALSGNTVGTLLANPSRWKLRNWSYKWRKGVYIHRLGRLGGALFVVIQGVASSV